MRAQVDFTYSGRKALGSEIHTDGPGNGRRGKEVSMYYSRGNKVKELREPEKTALIDIIFLLLIFFFVNLTVSEPGFHEESHPQPTPHRERELLKIVRPTEHTSRYLFIQVVDLREASAEYLETINDLRLILATLSGNFGLGLSFEPIPTSGFMVFTDFVKDNMHLYDIESMMRKAGELEEQLRGSGMTADLRAHAARLCSHYATFYPDPALGTQLFKNSLEHAEDRLESMIENTLSSVEIDGSERPDVLVSMPKTTYLYFLKSLYTIMGRGSLAEQDIHIHALEERT